LAALLVATAASPAQAQVFLASRPNPEFTIGPLFVRATVTPALGPITVDVLWSLVIPPTKAGADVEQDLYLLWPDEVDGLTAAGPPDPTLARYVEERGFSVTHEGRLPLFTRSLYRRRDQPPEPIAGGAPFVTFVRQGGPLGLTSPATYVRIPWTPMFANRTYLIDLRMGLPRLIKPRKATWVENAFWGRRYGVSLTFNDVRSRAMFPLYLENRQRLIRLADEPSQLLLNFAHADDLKIQEVFPQTASRRMSEALESTEVVSVYLGHSEGTTPQTLTVQFGYFTGWQSWAPVLIPILFFALGNLAGPLFVLLARRAGARLAGRIHVGSQPARQHGTLIPRETLARIEPGTTTLDDVLRLCGPDPEEHEQLSAPERRTLVYRGRRIVPERRRRFGWLATVSRWDAEYHEVEITLDRGVVHDVQARVRRTRLAQPDGGEAR
jgi:hypothetical protein